MRAMCMPQIDFESPIRPARPEDADCLAFLINEAGEGIPFQLWSALARSGEDPMQVGAARAARNEGGFSWRHAWVIDDGGDCVAMLLGYRQPDPYVFGDLSELPSQVLPCIELEAQAPGSWYINALAARPGRRGMGYGGRLLSYAAHQARHSGTDRLSLIVSEANRGALALYHRDGFREQARRPGVPEFEGGPFSDWLLMVKTLD